MTVLMAAGEGVAIGLALGIGMLLCIGALHSRSMVLRRRVLACMGTEDPERARGLAGLLARQAVRFAESLGSTADSVRCRLVWLGREPDVATFRVHQLLAALAGTALTATLLVVPLVRGTLAPAGAVVPVAIGATAGALAWDRFLTARATGRQSRIAVRVPDVSELMSLAVSAGESVNGALDRVARVIGPDLRVEIDRALADIRSGTPTAAALAAVAERNDVPVLTRLAQTLTTALERGTPLAGVLRDQATDIREESRRELMEASGRREVAMLVPVVFLILPVTVLFALYPGFIHLRSGVA